MSADIWKLPTVATGQLKSSPAVGSSPRANHSRRRCFQTTLLAWWDKNKIDYPWRTYKKPFHVLLAEILLRKTNAEKVQRLVSRVIAKIGTPEAITARSLRSLETLLVPFGMQRKKARELKQLARVLKRHPAGSVPSTLAGLKELPGVGDYIANAVLIVAFGNRQAVVDTNVIRVIERVFEFASPRSRPRTDPALWQYARELLPRRRVKQYNWALLDLAKKLCRAQRPKCQDCPLTSVCSYYKRRLLASEVSPRSHAWGIVRWKSTA
jgi:A/G-specific adenine glycosylase